MKANETSRIELLERDLVIMFNENTRLRKECENRAENRNEILGEVNKAMHYLVTRRGVKENQITDMNKDKENLTLKTFEALKLCEGELKGIESAIKQLEKVKALLRAYVL